jgi:hypothetical protein
MGQILPLRYPDDSIYLPLVQQINNCSQAGGTVVLQEGKTYLSGPLTLTGSVTLLIPLNATLQASSQVSHRKCISTLIHWIPTLLMNKHVSTGCSHVFAHLLSFCRGRGEGCRGLGRWSHYFIALYAG